MTDDTSDTTDRPRATTSNTCGKMTDSSTHRPTEEQGVVDSIRTTLDFRSMECDRQFFLPETVTEHHLSGHIWGAGANVVVNDHHLGTFESGEPVDLSAALTPGWNTIKITNWSGSDPVRLLIDGHIIRPVDEVTDSLDRETVVIDGESVIEVLDSPHGDLFGPECPGCGLPMLGSETDSGAFCIRCSDVEQIEVEVLSGSDDDGAGGGDG